MIMRASFPSCYSQNTAVIKHFHHSTSRKVAGSIPDEVIGFFSLYLILPAALGPGVYSASNRNEYQELIK
jgi:hypothetical protein